MGKGPTREHARRRKREETRALAIYPRVREKRRRAFCVVAWEERERERENSILALKEEKNSCKNISQLCLLTGGNRPSFFPAKEHSKEGEESAETTVVMSFLSRSPPSVVGSHSQFSLKEHFMARRSSTSSEGAARNGSIGHASSSGRMISTRISCDSTRSTSQASSSSAPGGGGGSGGSTSDVHHAHHHHPQRGDEVKTDAVKTQQDRSLNSVDEEELVEEHKRDMLRNSYVDAPYRSQTRGLLDSIAFVFRMVPSEHRDGERRSVCGVDRVRIRPETHLKREVFTTSEVYRFCQSPRVVDLRRLRR